MKVSRAQAEENHQAVINTASRLFRERGFDGIGLKDLMKGAGLTQGGFYRQFASKDDLVAKASQRAVEMAARQWTDAVATNPASPLEAVIAFYLSPEQGCRRPARGARFRCRTAEQRRQSMFRDWSKSTSPGSRRIGVHGRRRKTRGEGNGDAVSHGRRADAFALRQRREPRTRFS